jgi:hypothetical protein
MFVVLVKVNKEVAKIIGPFPDRDSAISYAVYIEPTEHYEAVCMDNVWEFSMSAVVLERPDLIVRD